jgi:hypothetical protein
MENCPQYWLEIYGKRHISTPGGAWLETAQAAGNKKSARSVKTDTPKDETNSLL